MGKTTSPPIRSKEGARRSQPRSARCFTRCSPQRDTYAGSWTARHSEERALLHEVVAPARHVRRLMDGSSQRATRAASRGGRLSEKGTPGSWTARRGEKRALLHGRV